MHRQVPVSPCLPGVTVVAGLGGAPAGTRVSAGAGLHGKEGLGAGAAQLCVPAPAPSHNQGCLHPLQPQVALGVALGTARGLGLSQSILKVPDGPSHT